MRQSVITLPARLTTLLLLLAALPAAAGESPPPQPAAAAAQAPSCLSEFAPAEARFGIPAGLLAAIGIAESGRADPQSGHIVPWPWTINAQGSGRYFDGAEAAKHAAAQLLEKNVGLVDVGCMQVDLYHHPHAFKTLSAAFDPHDNVTYAASFLQSLYHQYQSWPAAIAAYHAGDPADGADYLAHVLFNWKHPGGNGDWETAGLIHNPGTSRIVEAVPPPLAIAAEMVANRDCDSALAVYRAILKTTPDDSTAHLGAGQCLAADGHIAEARQHFERALTTMPDNEAALAALLRLIDGMPPAQRMAALLSARQIVPASWQIPARIAVLKAEENHLSDATQMLAEAVRIAPDNPVLRLDLALLLDHSGRSAEAVHAYRAFLAAYSQDQVPLTVTLDSVRQRYAYLQQHLN